MIQKQAFVLTLYNMTIFHIKTPGGRTWRII